MRGSEFSDPELAAMAAEGLVTGRQEVTVRLSAEVTDMLALGGVGELAVGTVVDASAPLMDGRAS